MPDSTFDIDAIARELAAARAARTTVPSLSARHPGWSVRDGYAVAHAIAAERVPRGERVVGRKVGMTNPAGWAALETDGPIWGHVYDSGLVHAAGMPARVDLGAATAARIEPEIGFCLRQVPDPARLEPAQLMECIEWIAPCFEIIDSHYAGWKFKAAEAVADFGVHYALVVGTPYRPDAQTHGAVVPQLAACEVTLARDGDVVATGRGALTLGHPLAALAALVRLLAADPAARPLEAGEIITTGTLTTPQDIAAGQRWTLSVAGLDLAPLDATFV